MRLKLAFLQATRKLAAMNTPFLFPLLHLPTELIVHIIEHVESCTALKSLARTCKRVQELTEPLLYRYALLRDGEQTRNLLNSAVASRPARAKAIQELDVPCKRSTTPFFRDLGILLGEACNLKRLTIESPECNTGDFEDEVAYKQMTRDLFEPFEKATGADHGSKLPLQKLQELILHLNGAESPYWTIERQSISLFQLPALQRLTLSCVNIEDDVLEVTQARSLTALKHLILEESNITHKGLLGILSLPKALESLYLGENCHNFANFEQESNPAASYLFRNDPFATLKALLQQKDSLKTLTYVAPEHYRSALRLKRQHSPVDAGFADFHRLESITLYGQCSNFERAVMSSRSPPSLKSLVFRTDESSWAPICQTTELVLKEIPFLRAPSCSVPATLSTLKIILPNEGYTAAITHVIDSAAKEMQRIGIDLEVEVQMRSRYFPPYLYGEPLPRILPIFSGDWVRRAIRSSTLSNSASSNEGSEWDSTSSDEGSERDSIPSDEGSEGNGE